MALMLKLCLTFLFADTFGLSLHSPALNLTLILEAFYLSFTFWLRKPLLSSDSGLFIALVLDTLLWISWLYFSGGATNAFISLLLLPIAIAAVLLPFWAPWSLALLSNLAYGLMLFTMPESAMSHHGMDMQSHYLGMWVNFIISSLVLTTSVALLAKRMRRQDAQLAFMREAQLRQEKLLALGTASAQMAHRLATPLGSLRLLVDELQDEGDGPVLQEMRAALAVCESTLTALRSATESIREGAQRLESVEQLLSSLSEQVNLLMPAVTLSLQSDEALEKVQLRVDASLQPALLALIENGARASQEVTGEQKVTLWVQGHGDELVFGVRDFGSGIPPSLVQQLGHQIIEQPKGMGVALLLSHASLERLGGRLILGSHVDGGAVAQVYLPIQGAA
ncbi:ATP-binding protein [Shewanella insulae]|uniref:sensor histidine kinase n=1 Tax=Shewanella insulae TaxID=2681496 RepID=UPI001EFE2146|nr:HAMP domain-containing sensor histidine kinase [Shewanella insulae]MCG9712423.1 ATP-binding protein [Shewanella insulae]